MQTRGGMPPESCKTFPLKGSSLQEAGGGAGARGGGAKGAGGAD